jgi:hypothetical protein
MPHEMLLSLKLQQSPAYFAGAHAQRVPNSYCFLVIVTIHGLETE